MNLGGNRRWVPLRKSGTSHLILEIGISPTSPPGLFPTHFLREKPWGRGWYLANLHDRGKGGGGVRGLLLTRPHGLIKKKNLWHSGYLVTVPTALLPWVPEVFLACSRSHERRSAGHYKDLTETGNRARKVSGTQGTALFVTQFL